MTKIREKLSFAVKTNKKKKIRNKIAAGKTVYEQYYGMSETNTYTIHECDRYVFCNKYTPLK